MGRLDIREHNMPDALEKLAVVVGQVHLADGQEDVAVRPEPLDVGAVGRDDEARDVLAPRAPAVEQDRERDARHLVVGGDAVAIEIEPKLGEVDFELDVAVGDLGEDRVRFAKVLHPGLEEGVDVLVGDPGGVRVAGDGAEHREDESAGGPGGIARAVGVHPLRRVLARLDDSQQPERQPRPVVVRVGLKMGVQGREGRGQRAVADVAGQGVLDRVGPGETRQNRAEEHCE